MAITLYGIPNCDTVRKARRYLDEAAIEYRFHDFRKDGLDGETVSAWLQQIPLDTLINKRGTTWRVLPDDEKAALSTASVQALAVAHPAIVKRPVVDWGETLTVGFDAADWATRIG